MGMAGIRLAHSMRAEHALLASKKTMALELQGEQNMFCSPRFQTVRLAGIQLTWGFSAEHGRGHVEGSCPKISEKFWGRSPLRGRPPEILGQEPSRGRPCFEPKLSRTCVLESSIFQQCRHTLLAQGLKLWE